MATTLIVVPCYNEAARFRPEPFAALATVDLDLMFVNDGSTDRTEQALRDFASPRPAVKVFSLDRNSGKAEAVRRGFQQAFASGYDVIGYADADLATPPAELLRLLGVLRTRPDVSVVMGARVKLLGTHIDRKSTRHY